MNKDTFRDETSATTLGCPTHSHVGCGHSALSTGAEKISNLTWINAFKRFCDNSKMFTNLSLLRRLTRLVLVWYVLFVGASVLAATLQPKSMDVVCSTMGIMKVVVQGDDAQASQVMVMDCPLCAHATPALPLLPSLSDAVKVISALSYALMPVSEAVLVSLTAPPLPSRGPPVSN
jgi:hypothetical protein